MTAGLDLTHPVVMGILNLTPDSFSDGGEFDRIDAAIARAHEMADAGAAIIDIGGESTRPRAEDVSVDDELKRVIPVIRQLAESLAIPISIDTSKPEVMFAAVEVGASMINDVYALRRAGALQAVAALQVPVCLMHMQGEPRGMQRHPTYTDVVAEVRAFLIQRIAACNDEGVETEQILVDPGFGFGKQLDHNLQLLRGLETFTDLGAGLLVGLSRKSMFGQLLDAAVGERLPASLAAATLAVCKGADVVRVHDVRPTCDTLAVCRAVSGA